ncbi:MAG: hypothetical protein C4K47_05835 [Candidatus Thorarchaeota archaeon]|nr:MAG: hypothetical protein C4K47_05835 [Candidatus Thorarchaeota archaeon]
MTTLHDITKFLQSIAPRELSVRDIEARVEIGPQTESEQAKTTVNRILVATYPSARAVTKASQDKANLLITYRPIFPFALDRLYGFDLIRVRLLTKNYISAYTIGSAWASANGGLTDALVETLGLKALKEFRTLGTYSETVPLGRICEPPGVMNHSGFANYVAGKMGLEGVEFGGELDDELGPILVIAGDLTDLLEISEAKKQDIETIVTGELLPETRTIAVEEGINTVELGAFFSEEPGMKRLKYQLSLEFAELKLDFIDSPPLSKTLRPYSQDMA